MQLSSKEEQLIITLRRRHDQLMYMNHGIDMCAEKLKCIGDEGQGASSDLYYDLAKTLSNLKISDPFSQAADEVMKGQIS